MTTSTSKLQILMNSDRTELTSLGRARVYSWMLTAVHRDKAHVDDVTSEVNTTELAEAAAEQFQLYANPDDASFDDDAAKIPDDVYEVATDAATAYEDSCKCPECGCTERSEFEDNNKSPWSIEYSLLHPECGAEWDPNL